MTTEIETINDCLVGMIGDDIAVLMPKSRMTRQQALRMAAWLVILADQSESNYDEFMAVFEACRDT